MFVRVVLAVAFSFVAITFAQRKGNRAQDHASEETVGEEDGGDGKEIYTYADARATAKEKEEEAKCVSAFSPALSGKSYQESDQLLLPEFDDLLNGGVNFPSDSEKSRVKYDSDDSVESKRYETNSEDDEALEIFEALTASSKERSQPANEESKRSSNNMLDSSSGELAQLKTVVMDLQQKEMKLQAELIEYYGLKEQEKSHLELEKQLRRKNVEIERLNLKLASLEEHARILSEELKGKEIMKEELDNAHKKIKDLQKTIHSDAGQTKAQLLMLKQKVAILQESEQEASNRDLNMEQKFQTLKELEVEVMELRRTIKDLQHQKRELTVKLNVAEAKIAELLSRNESDTVVEMQAQTSTLKQANEDLSKQVEGLQMNRFSEVEELVYLRWVNACLRYELRNFQAPPGKATALELGKSLSPKSQEKAKQLMMEYAGPDLLAAKSREHSEHDYDSISSFPSTPSEGDFDDSSFDGHWTRPSSTKKSGLLKKLKKWGRSKEENQISPASFSSDLRSSPAPGHRHTRSKGSLETLILRNSSDSIAITSFGTNDFESSMSTDSNEPLGEPRLMRSRSSSDANEVSSNVASSFDLMSKSVSGVLEEKYPAFKDRHKLALAREKVLKDKADQARVEKLVEKLKPVGAPSTKRERVAPGKINPDRFTQVGRDIVSATEHNPVRMVVNKMQLSEVQKRAPRVPKPAPKSAIKGPSSGGSQASLGGVSSGPPLPPPPPPPPRVPGAPPPPPPPPGSLKVQGAGGEQVQRAPGVVEFYQSLMRREAKKDTTVGATDMNVSDVRNNMIGEIENRSTFLLAVKADVEMQGDFVQSLAAEVREAAYTDVEDVISFVAWLDDELSFLVDERAVLKHFDWPESKADVLREAAFEYQDLKKLEIEVSSLKDDSRMSCESSLKKMLSLLEKVEQSVYALLRTRDMAIARYKEFSVPTHWMLDSGLVGKIKLATVQLARKYMRRVASELDSSEVVSSVKEPQREFLLLQGVRFAFRVHQFAGGFDAESMRTFEELRDRVRTQKTMGDSDSACNASEAT